VLDYYIKYENSKKLIIFNHNLNNDTNHGGETCTVIGKGGGSKPL